MEKQINKLEISGQISKQELKDKVMKELRSKEVMKARNLLATAMSNFDAMQYMKKQLEDKIKNGK